MLGAFLWMRPEPSQRPGGGSPWKRGGGLGSAGPAPTATKWETTVANPVLFSCSAFLPREFLVMAIEDDAKIVGSLGRVMDHPSPTESALECSGLVNSLTACNYLAA